MKILFIWHSLVEKEYRKILFSLTETDCEILAITPTRWTEGGKLCKVVDSVELPKLKIEPCKVIFHNRIKVFFYPEILKLVNLVKKFDPDIIHIFEEPYSLVVFQFILLNKLLSTRAKIVVQSFENIFIHQTFPFSVIEKFNLTLTDSMIVVPGDGKDIWQKKGYKKEIIQIPVGLDNKLFRKIAERTADEVSVCFIGRLIKEKGIFDLLSVFSKLVKEGLNVKLVFVGQGKEKKKLKTVVEKEQLITRVVFVDRIENENLPEFLSKEIDILVLPSVTTKKWKEQFGRVLIEAMACEVVVVGSSSGEIPNVIGDAGFIFPEGDKKTLLGILKKLVLEPELRGQMAKLGRQRVETYFTWDKIAERIKGIYTEVMKCD